MVLLFGRMVSPGSERHTLEWFQKRSALSEFPDVNTLSGSGKDLLYEIGEALYAHKERLEGMLYRRERELFPHTATTIFLYDITNTYFEGNAMGNALAARGHCKSKRFDRPLITLSLVVDDNGLPILSRIFKGNQSEPETLEGVLTRLPQQIYGVQDNLYKATIVMDRGIATAENVAWLSSQGYPYIVVKRENLCEEYRRQFEESSVAFECVRPQKSIYGDENNVYIRKEVTSDGLCRVLCISEGRTRKERAMDAGKERPFLEDIESFRNSIRRGTIKNQAKIEAKLRRIIERHAKMAARYEVALDVQEGKVQGILLQKKETTSSELFGCYVIETSHVEYSASASASAIRHLYTTLTRVESAFRSMNDILKQAALMFAQRSI